MDIAGRRARQLIGLTMAAMVLVPAGSASAGRLLATGHDPDHHCGRAEEKVRGQCHFFQVAVDFVRGGAPDPAKPVLVLDRGHLDVVQALDRTYGAGVVPRVVLDPRSSAFAAEPISTDRYSAIIIASSKGATTDPTQQDLNEAGSTPDSDAINARKGDLKAFFDAGGGIFANSGSTHATGAYYAFLPIGVQGAERVREPFSLTDVGRSLGLTEDDVTCCETHNTFEQPSSESALRAVDVDSAGKIVSLLADTPRFQDLGDPAVPQEQLAQEAARDLPSQSQCVRPDTVALKLRRPKRVRYSRATVFINGKRVLRLKGKRITRRMHFRMPARGALKVRIVVITTGKRKITIRRTYRPCS